MLATILQGGDSLFVSALIFAASAAIVWPAGARVAGYADRLARATGASGALVGLVLLGGVTSLPEIATSATAALTGEGELAANNLIGGVSLQLMALVVVDALIGRGALTSMVPRPDVLAYAAMNIGLLSIVGGFAAAGDIEIPGLGLGSGSVVVLFAYALCIYSARAIGKGATWRPVAAAEGDRPAQPPPDPDERAGDSVAKLSLLIGAAGMAILAGGYLLARSGDALADQTGLGANFFGAVFLAGATSLPELSSAIAAVKLNRPQMAIGDILGGNLFNLALLALVDGLYRRGPVLAELGAFSAVAATLGSLLCAILIVGLVERRDRSVLRIGYDSAAMIAVYLAGLVALYALRNTGS